MKVEISKEEAFRRALQSEKTKILNAIKSPDYAYNRYRVKVLLRHNLKLVSIALLLN